MTIFTRVVSRGSAIDCMHQAAELAIGRLRMALWGAVIVAVGLATVETSWAQTRTAVLADAIERADWERVDEIVEGAGDAELDVRAVQPDLMTALHWAAWHDRPELVARLLELGADVDAANRYGVRPLAIACENGGADVAKLLLRAGADPNGARAGGETALMTAARSGRVELVEALIESGAQVDARDRRGQTALMWAAAEGHRDVVDRLLAAGADGQVALDSGMSPLMFAVREGRSDVVRLLLERGVDVNGTMRPRNPGGRTARRRTSPLLLAIENGHFQLAAELLDAGADPNDQRSGFTPLHVISWVRKPNLGDGLDGDPPPIGSGSMTSLELVRLLVAKGADVNRPLQRGRSGRAVLGHKGATPLLLAADTADLPLLQLLVELGADPHTANADGTTPLMAAAGYGTLAPGEEAGTEAESLEVVKWLLDRDADVNTVDAQGETAMHGAAYASFPQMVELLVARGADVEIWNQPNRHGWTPLKIAQGYRPGNFKPHEPTIEAIRRAMGVVAVSQPAANKVQ